MIDDLQQIVKPYDRNQPDKAIQAITVNYAQNTDAFETGPHLATISVDLLTAEARHFSPASLKNDWIEQSKIIMAPGAFQSRSLAWASGKGD